MKKKKIKEIELKEERKRKKNYNKCLSIYLQKEILGIFFFITDKKHAVVSSTFSPPYSAIHTRKSIGDHNEKCFLLIKISQ